MTIIRHKQSRGATRKGNEWYGRKSWRSLHGYDEIGTVKAGFPEVIQMLDGTEK